MKLLPVRVEKQAPSACGPYVLAAVLVFMRRPVAVRTLLRKARTSRKRGTSPENMIRAAQQLGCRVRVKQWAEISDLVHAVRQNAPPIVLWFSEHEGHYSVIAGVDRTSVYLVDPELGGIRKLPRRVFRRVWFDFSTSEPERGSKLYARWMMVIEPRNA